MSPLSPSAQDPTDEELLDFLEHHSYDLKTKEIPYNDDADVVWEVIAHHMTPPRQRVYGYADTARGAIRCAMAHVMTHGCYAPPIDDVEGEEWAAMPALTGET